MFLSLSILALETNSKYGSKMKLSTNKSTKEMKTTTTTIINGTVLGQNSINFNSKVECDNYFNGLMAYINDKELEIKSNNEAFTTSSTEIDGEHVSSFSCDKFKYIIMDNYIAWEESGVITICSLENE